MASKPTPKIIHSQVLFKALVEAGVFSQDEQVLRFVIDADAGDLVKIYVQRAGDEKLIPALVELLPGVPKSPPKSRNWPENTTPPNGTNLLEYNPGLELRTTGDEALLLVTPASEYFPESQQRLLPEKNFVTQSTAVYVPDHLLNTPSLVLMRTEPRESQNLLFWRRVETLTECYEILEKKDEPSNP